MADSLITLIQKLSLSTDENNGKQFSERFEAVTKYLGALTAGRVLVSYSDDFDFPASSVAVLRNLIRLGAKTTYTIAMYGTDDTQIAAITADLHLLIPQFETVGTAFQLDGSEVTVIKLESALDATDFAITGGFDTRAITDPPLDLINAKYYLQLQPYGWTLSPNMVYVNNDGAKTSFNLDTTWPDALIGRRAYYRAAPAISQDEWTALEAGDYKVQASICQYLFETAEAKTINLATAVGVDQKGTPDTTLYNLTAGILLAQETDAGAKEPTVVVVASDVRTPEWASLLDYIEYDAKTNSPAASPDFSSWHTKHNVATRVFTVGEPGVATTLSAVQAAVGKLTNNQVLLVYLGVIPTVLSDKSYGDSVLPSVATWMGDTDLLINLGKPYFKLTTDTSDSDFSYPTLPLASAVAASTESVDATDRTFNGITFSSARKWFSTRATYPPTQLPDMFAAAFDNTTSLGAYFKSLHDYYQNADGTAVDESDKLARALDLVVNIVIPGTQPKQSVEDLYKALCDATVDGVLPLLKVITGGMFYDFWLPVLDASGKNFTVTNADPQINEDKTVVTITGTQTTDLGIGNTKLDFEFTKTGNLINAKVMGTLTDASWAPSGAQWLSFSNFGLGVALDTFAAVPVTVYVSVDVQAGTKFTMLFTIPSDEGKVQLQVTFTEDNPSIDTLFQLVGGINLQAILPTQIAVLTSIAVNEMQFRYDYGSTPQSLEFFSINLGTPADKSWDLVPNVSVKSLSFQALVNNPGNTATRKTKYNIDGAFAIAGGDGYVSASVPALRVTGGLTDTSAPVKVYNLIQSFLGTTLANALPTNVANTAITVLNFSVDKSLGTYSFTMRVDTNWIISFMGATLFTIESLGFAITATSQEIDPNEGSGSPSTGNTTTTKIDGSFDGTILIPLDQTITLSVIAKYTTDTSWTFEGKQVAGSVSMVGLINKYLKWNLGDSYDFQIQDLDLIIATKDGSWSFSGAIVNWNIPFLGLTIPKVTALVGYKAPDSQSVGLLAGTGTAVSLADSGGCEGAGTYGRIEADLVWSSMNIKLNVYYDYCPNIQKFGIIWGGLEGSVTGPINPEGDWVASLSYNGTLGSIIEEFISWATGARFTLDAPWNIVDSINLSGLQLQYTFNSKDSSRNKVSFVVNIGPINLGFATIEAISVDYQSTGPNKGVNVTIKGSFSWIRNTDGSAADSIGPWDASKPGTAPSPSGQGNKYLDLRLLAMGQHVTASCFPTADTVQKAIDCMAQLPPTEPGEVPNITFAADSNWLIGTDFGVLKLEDDSSGGGTGTTALMRRPTTALATTGDTSNYFITLQIVFNDPYLYGLRIALEGKPAKIFAGLDFQIMYRQISDSVGVYQAQLTLPKAMRTLSIGAYTLTLPVFGIAVYTNGDFQVDVGFPWNEDFSRSLTIEGIIYPGIPVLGSAGFYFGKLSSATTNKVPQITNGTFNPVIVFGFGLQIGFGKSIEYGILSAGFSVTAVGIIEGVIAKFNPYQITDGGADNQVQGEYYFWLRGTVGIIGKVFGTVDFAIIKANVNVTVKLLLQLTYESYVSISITVIAEVSVSVEVKIDLGLFSISISFSFNMRLKETFTIENSGTPPWQLKGGGGSSAQTLARSSANRVRALRERAFKTSMLMGVAEVTSAPNWSNLTNPGGTDSLSGYFAPALTVASNEWSSNPTLGDQPVCLVGIMTIDTVPPSSGGTAQPAATDTSFEKLAKQVLRWAIAAVTSQQTPAQVDASIVTADTLTYLLETVLVSSDTNQTPISPDAVDAFLSSFFMLTAVLPPETEGTAQTAYFPMASKLSLSVPAYGSLPALSYTFGGYNTISDSALGALRTYFDQLAVQVQQEMDGSALKSAQAPATTSYSMASWIVSDYFLLMARQMVQAAQDGLRSFQYTINTAQSSTDVVNWINTTGQLEPGSDAYYTLYELFNANQSHVLNSSTLTVGVIWPVQNGSQSFTDVADGSTSLEANTIALANAANAAILKPGTVISYPNAPDYTVGQNDTLITVASQFRVQTDPIESPTVTAPATVAQLIANGYTMNGTTRVPLLQMQLLSANANVLLPYVTQQATSGASFTAVVQAAPWSNAYTPTALATQNAGTSILQKNAKITYKGSPYTVLANQSLGDVANALNTSLSDLLQNSDVLTNDSLFIPVALLYIPQFQSATQTNDTLQAFAARFGTTLEVLAPDLPAQQPNGAVTNLWSLTDSSGSSTPYIDVPHLVQFKVSELIAEAQKTGAIAHLSGMASRYYFHGLRIPTVDPKDPTTPWITANTLGMWVQKNGNTYSLPSMAGLFALTGQQFPVTTIGSTAFTATLDRTNGPTWITFKDSGGNTTNTLTVSIASGSQYATRISLLSSYTTQNRLPVDLTALGPEVVAESNLVSYSFNSAVLWQTAGPVTLPYGTSGTGVQSLKLWKLPDSLINLPDPSTRAINPRFAVKVARYDEATGVTIDEPVTSWGWSSIVTFNIKRLPATTGSTAAPDTYEISGAAGNDIQILERIVDQLQNDDSAIQQVIVGYQPDQAGSTSEGVQTDLLSAVTMGIAQVNLSTVTRPPGNAFMLRMLGVEENETAIGLLNTPTAFIRLLWEASITNNGGYYLYYYNGDTAAGLPDRVFNDRGEATLSLIVMYSSTLDNAVADYMNSVATSEANAATNSTYYAEANPSQPVITPQAPYTLGGIAYQYYTDLGDLVALPSNSALSLAAGATLALNHGTYQAPPGGIALATVASQFGTTVAALQQANGGTLSDPLAALTAIWLPDLTLVAGTSPHTSSLSDIATWYGENIVTLAADNATVPNIFKAGAQLTITGGPTTRSSKVPAGVALYNAVRPAPPDIPLQTDPNWAKIFLQHNFNLLGYKVLGNKWFTASQEGLPAGPTTQSSTPTNNFSKVRAAKAQQAGDIWTYAQQVPFPQFAIPTPTDKIGSFLPLATASPYRGIDALLQVDFTWQDYFGNKIITTLSNPQAGDPQPYNDPLLLTGYTDAVVGLSQWPSVASAWQIIPPASTPQIELDLTFDPTRYQGLISAAGATATTIKATFTNPINATSGSDLTRWTVSDGITTIKVTNASVSPDGLTVTLTIDTSMAENTKYSVTATNIAEQASPSKLNYSGTASFVYGGDPAESTSTLVQNASNDLSVYETLYYQCTDPAGIGFTIDCSAVKGTITLTAAQIQPLLDWLFNGVTGTSTSIYQFVQDRSKGGTTVAAPPLSYAVDVPLTGQTLNTDQIYLLTLTFTVARTGGLVYGDLAAESGMRSSATIVAALVDTSQGNTAASLDTFAENFESALTVSGAYRMKVATGVDRDQVTTSRSTPTVWAVRIGSVPAQAINYSINDVGNPAVFAPQPISNELQTRTSVPIWDYTTGTAINFQGPASYNLSFTNVDMDVWGRQLFAGVDSLLTPTYTAAIQIVSKEKGVDYLAGTNQLLDQKKYLAGMAKLWMNVVYAGETDDPTQAQEAFYQQLLTLLSNAYTTRAALGFDATVNASVSTPPPRLFGNVLINSISTASAGVQDKSEITLTSPKLELATSSDAPITFLLSSPDTVRGASGEVVATIDLDLTYNGTTIEHQIGTPSGIQDYEASSWLTFVISDTETVPVVELSRELGKFTIPMLLRSYPQSPTMPQQNFVATNAGSTDLALLRQWNYTFTYSLPFHYPQDRVYGSVEFNIQQNAMMLASFLDHFNDIAEYITVYPKVLVDLNGILAQIDATIDPTKPDDKKKIDDSAAALQSVVEMLSRITGNTGSVALQAMNPPATLIGDPALTYTFYIAEGEVSIGSTPAALLVSIVGAVPSGIGTPQVLIDPDTYTITPYSGGSPCTNPGTYCYVYLKTGTTDQYLAAVDGQQIADRTVVLPQLDVFQRQNAWATVYLTRNDFDVNSNGVIRHIADPFIYKTPDVTFSSALTPTLNVREPLPISYTGSLDSILTSVFNSLLTNNTQQVIVVQANVEYDYALNAALEPVGLPVFMQPPLSIVVIPGGSGDEDLATMITNWTTMITNWFNTNTPAGGGQLLFNVTILSNLTIPSMPVLWLHELVLPISQIVPPLKTSS